MEFTQEEREMYTTLRANPDLAKLMFNAMALRSFADDYDRSPIQVARFPIPLRSSTTPVLAAPAPARAATDLPLPGMVPFQRVLAVAPHRLTLVVVGNLGFRERGDADRAGARLQPGGWPNRSGIAWPIGSTKTRGRHSLHIPGPSLIQFPISSWRHCNAHHRPSQRRVSRSRARCASGVQGGVSVRDAKIRRYAVEQHPMGHGHSLR